MSPSQTLSSTNTKPLGNTGGLFMLYSLYENDLFQDHCGTDGATDAGRCCVCDAEACAGKARTKPCAAGCSSAGKVF